MHRLRTEFEARGETIFKLHADVMVEFNGRPPRRLIEPRVDLSLEPKTWGSLPWILPLGEDR